jgi:hypothetical protein
VRLNPLVLKDARLEDEAREHPRHLDAIFEIFESKASRPDDYSHGECP